MLGREIRDDVESGAGVVAGLGLLPVVTAFETDKVLARPAGEWRGHAVTTAYEIHHGRVTVESGEPFLDGVRIGRGQRHPLARSAGERRVPAGATWPRWRR